MECCIVILGMVASLIRLGLTGISGVLTFIPCINSWICSTCKIGIDFLMGGGQSLISLILTGAQAIPCIVNYIEIVETAIGDLIAALGK